METESSNREKKTNLHKIAHLIRYAFLIVLVGLYGWLMVGDSIPLLGFAILASLTLAYWLFGGRFGIPSQLDFQMLMLLSLAGLSLSWVGNRELATPKFYGLLLGAISFYFILSFIKHKAALRLPILALIVMALVLSVFGLISNPTLLSLGFVQNLLAPFPQLQNWLSAGGGELINRNSLAGAISFFPPLLVSLLWDNDSYYKAFLRATEARKRKNGYKTLLVFALFLTLLVLLLSGSRGAIMGGFAGILFVASLRDKRIFKISLILLGVGLIVGVVFFRNEIVQFIRLSDINADLPTLQYRSEIWNYSLRLIRDFPITGVGLDNFDSVLRGFYFYQTDIFQVRYIAHSHNTFLAVAVELGLPGLILFTSLIGSFFAMAFYNWKHSGSLRRVLSLGLAAGMLAFLLFGVMDAFTLGKKLGIFFWIFLGLMAAVHRLNFTDHKRKARAQLSWAQAFGQAGIWLGLWLLCVLLSVYLVSYNTLLAVLLAIILGLLVGVGMIFRWNKMMSRSEEAKL